MLVFYLLLIIFFCFVLIKATDILVDTFERLAKKTRVGKFALTSFILGLATSLPEFFVAVVAALEGEPNLVLGNVIGANIANLSLVVGGTALVSGSINVVGGFLKKDIFYTFLAGSLPLLLLLDNRLSRVDGLILLIVYFWYNLTVLTEKKIKTEEEGEVGLRERILRRFNYQVPERELGWIFAGVILLIFSAEMIVKIAKKMAVLFHVPLLLIGIFLVSIGTTLPELSFGLEAIKKRQAAMVFGNLLGSVVANSTLILGLAALIAPIEVHYLGHYLVATIAFVVIFGMFWFFVRSKRKLERWEGGVLFLIYLLFAAFEFLR